MLNVASSNNKSINETIYEYELRKEFALRKNCLASHHQISDGLCGEMAYYLVS